MILRVQIIYSSFIWHKPWSSCSSMQKTTELDEEKKESSAGKKPLGQGTEEGRVQAGGVKNTVWSSSACNSISSI